MVVELNEQITVSRLIEVSVEDFDYSLDGWKLHFLATYSQPSPRDLAKKFAKQKRLRILDDRCALTEEEQGKRDYLENLIEASERYLSWLQNQSFQPLKRSSLISQCVDFENLLKTVAVASVLSKEGRGGLERLLFVPSKDFRTAHKQVNSSWDRLAKNRTPDRYRVFVEEFLISNQLFTAHYAGLQRLDLNRWATIWEQIFQLRNALVHSRGRPVEQVEIGLEIFSPFDEAQVSESTLRVIDESFRAFSGAFQVSIDDL